MPKKALVVIDIQNDITKNYKEIIDNINAAIDWAASHDMPVVYIRHFNLSAGTRNFKPDTPGAELAPDLKVVSDNIFDKSKSNALTSEPFERYINENEIGEFVVVGADATVCVKSTCFNLRKVGYEVTVLSDCVTSWDKKKLPDMTKSIQKSVEMPVRHPVSFHSKNAGYLSICKAEEVGDAVASSTDDNVADW